MSFNHTVSKQFKKIIDVGNTVLDGWQDIDQNENTTIHYDMILYFAHLCMDFTLRGMNYPMYLLGMYNVNKCTCAYTLFSNLNNCIEQTKHTQL